MNPKLQSEIQRVDADLFAYPRCHIRQSTAAQLGISEEARQALLDMTTLPTPEPDRDEQAALIAAYLAEK